MSDVKTKKEGAQQASKGSKGSMGAYAGVKHTTEYVRSHMATGGGTPIPKGHKMTNEHRVLQPRQDDGTFGHNADGEYGLKYPAHGKGVAIPMKLQDLALATGVQEIKDGIKAGTVINWNGKTQILLKDMSYKELKDYFAHFDEEQDEYYSAKFDEKKAYNDDPFESNEGKSAQSFSSNFAKKHGRMSDKEKNGIAKGAFILGNYDMSKMSNTTSAEMKSKFEQAEKGFKLSAVNTAGVVALDPNSDEYQTNKAYNEWYDAYHKNKSNSAGPTNQIPNSAGPKNDDGSNDSDDSDADFTNEIGNDNESSSSSTHSGAPKIEGVDKAPKGIFSNGSFSKGTIDYNNNPEHKKFFNAMAEDMKKNPDKYHMTPGQVKQLAVGGLLANLAKKGMLDILEFDY